MKITHFKKETRRSNHESKNIKPILQFTRPKEYLVYILSLLALTGIEKLWKKNYFMLCLFFLVDKNENELNLIRI